MAIPGDDDPCALYLYLRERYFSHVGGDSETLIRDRGPESEQEVRFGKTDLATLRDEMQRAKQLCDEQNGVVTTPRRFAITGGARRTLGG